LVLEDPSPSATADADNGSAAASPPTEVDRPGGGDPPSDAAPSTLPAPEPSAAPPAAQAAAGAAPSNIAPGTRIADKYVVERLIGEGGLGVVLAARHVHLDQVVAIKSLRPNALANKGVAERFLREARLAAKIRSEHVVHVYDVGTLPDGTPYMIMEYLAGTDLGRQLNATGPLPVDKAVDYVLQACEALAEAHIAGIVHRDIKPDNLFIATSAGGKSILKILDFGISKMATRQTDSGNELTEAGDKFGTPVYMSPEQLLSARDVDARTDVWAIGVVLYELLTGRLPFDGDLPELCAAIINKPPVPLATARPYLPESLQGVIDRCLAKNLEERFQNVAELAQELRPFAGPVSQARIDHVVQLIRGAGEPVRLSLLPAPQASGRALREEPTLAETTERAATTGSGVAAWGAVPAGDSKDGRGGRARVAALVMASLAAAAIGLAAIASGRSHSAASAQPPALVSAPNIAADVPPPAALPPSAPQPVPAVATEPEVTAAASSTAASSSQPAYRKPPRGVSSARPRSPGTSDPNAVINPFE
jgi:serine/threonine-protein kinase